MEEKLCGRGGRAIWMKMFNMGNITKKVLLLTGPGKNQRVLRFLAVAAYAGGYKS